MVVCMLGEILGLVWNVLQYKVKIGTGLWKLQNNLLMPIEKKESNMFFGLVFQNGFGTGWECCLAGQYNLLSCIWLDGQRWM
jgi:hypothetical protein